MHTSHYPRLEKPTIPLATHERLQRRYYTYYLSLRIRTTDASQLEKRNKEQIKRERRGKKREESEKRTYIRMTIAATAELRLNRSTELRMYVCSCAAVAVDQQQFFFSGFRHEHVFFKGGLFMF